MADTSPPLLTSLLSASELNEKDMAWEAFVTEFSRIILKAACNSSASQDETMDRYAFVLEKMREDDFRRLRGFDPKGRGSFTTWLFLVTRRLSIDHHRHRYGRQTALPEGDESPPGVRSDSLARRRLADLLGEEMDLVHLPDSSTPDPETHAWLEERKRVLEEGLDGLSPRDQLLITLRYVDEVSVRQIARAMGYRSPFQVYRRLKGVLSQLRAHLEHHGVTEL
jgi:RNA polymerase sigma factor (sigma-70 family)